MKKLLTLSILVGALLAPSKTNACLDYHDSIYVTCDYSANFQEILITVHNMELFGGPQGAFCTCAISNYTNLFSNIQYVAFVDSGSFNPIQGFMPWTGNVNATSAWNNATTGNWDGFLSEVNSAGIITGVPVELLIRATPPPGFVFSQVDSSLTQSSLGTDEFDNVAQDLANSHNSVSGFTSGGPITYEEHPMSYFNAIDSEVLSVNSEDISLFQVSIFPNPTNQIINFKLPELAILPDNITLYSQSGEIVLEHAFSGQLDISSFANGLYYIKISSKNNSEYYKIVKE